MRLANDTKPKSRFRRVLGIGLAIVALAIGVGYFTLPYISLIGAPVAQLNTGDLADTTFNGSDGKEHKLSDYRGKVLVLEWTSPVCEFTIRHYESGAMHALQEYGAGKQAAWIPVSPVGPGSVGHLDAAGLQALLKARKISSPYIAMDEGGILGHLFGAHATPSAAVIDVNGKLAYMGAIDDNPWGDGTAGKNFVRQALDELAAGNAVSVPFRRSYGCSIKYPDASKG
jgi:hypothetical protein